MLETTFRSIIQFRQHTGSIRTHKHVAASARTRVYGFSCHGVRTLFCMFLSCRQCECHVLKGMVTQAASSFSSRVTCPLRSNSRDSQRPGLVQPETRTDSRSGTHLHTTTVAVSPKIMFKKKIILHMFEFPRHNFRRCQYSWSNLRPIGLYFVLASAKHGCRQIKCRVMW